MGRLVAVVLVLVASCVISDDAGCEEDEEVCNGALQDMVRAGRIKKDVLRFEDRLRCGSTESVPFCWWAIELGNPQWQLLKNGNSALIETNIKPFCLGKSSTLGFSFMNVTTDIIYDEQQESGYTTLKTPTNNLVDVFYICCTDGNECSKLSGLRAPEMIEHLADTLLEYANMASGVVEPTGWLCTKRDGQRMARLPGVDVCLFVASTAIRTRIYSGPMLFNRFILVDEPISDENMSLSSLATAGRLCRSRKADDGDYGSYLKDGECLRYISRNEYFLFCCCYENDHWCRYSSHAKRGNMYRINSEFWQGKRELGVAHNVRHNNRLITAHKWSFRDFVYSKPVKRTNSVNAYASVNNHRLWHCMTGNLTLMNANGTTQPSSLERINRSELPYRGQSCFLDTKLRFTKTGKSMKVTRIGFEYGHSEQACSRMQCELVEPVCLDDMLTNSLAVLDARVRCCCGTHNLCNHIHGGYKEHLNMLNMIEFSKVCVAGIYWMFANLISKHERPTTISCLHYYDFSVGRERFMIEGESFYVPLRRGEKYIRTYFNTSNNVQFKVLLVVPLFREGCDTVRSRHVMQLGVAYCTGDIRRTLALGSCDTDYAKEFSTAMERTKRAQCYEGQYTISANGIVPSFPHGMKVMKTFGVPLCHDEVSLIDEDGTVIIRSGRVEDNADFERFLEPNVTNMPEADNGLAFRIEHICDPDIVTGKPCNGLASAMRNLMPVLMTFHTMRTPKNVAGAEIKLVSRRVRAESKCSKVDNREVKCSTSVGCFHFHGFDGSNPLAGCIEDIPRAIPERFHSLIRCRNMLWSKEDSICNAILDVNNANTLGGVLCCCKRKCPAPVRKSPTSNLTGFSPFQF